MSAKDFWTRSGLWPNASKTLLCLHLEHDWFIMFSGFSTPGPVICWNVGKCSLFIWKMPLPNCLSCTWCLATLESLAVVNLHLCSRSWADRLAVFAYAMSWQWGSTDSDVLWRWRLIWDLGWLARACAMLLLSQSMPSFIFYMREWPKPFQTGQGGPWNISLHFRL